jgi:myo-inositol 2-dehydrogenase/D-chiro-inositol 1-dehydrogenase
LREGRIGDIETVSITSRDPAPPTVDYIRRSGGLFRDMMIHDLDLARFLLAEEPVEIFASGAALFDAGARAEGDVDTAVAMLKTARGALCQITCSRRASYGYDQRIEVHGSKGMLRAGNIHTTTVECADRAGFHADPLLHFFLERYMPAYQRELDHFIDAVLRGAPASPSGRDGLRAQRLADAATDSVSCGRPVRLSGED